MGDEINPIHEGKMFRDFVEIMTRSDEKQYPGGEIFNYSNMDTVALGLLVEKAAGMSFSSYFEKTVWAKAGAESRGAWIVNAKKQPSTFQGFSATSHDWIRIGLLVLRELKSQSCFGEFVRQATSRQIGGVLLGSGYGYQVWQDCAPDVDFCFVGFGGQYLLFNVEHGVVIYQHATSLSPAILGTPYVMSGLIYGLSLSK